MPALHRDVDAIAEGLHREAEILTVAPAPGRHSVLERPPRIDPELARDLQAILP